MIIFKVRAESLCSLHQAVFCILNAQYCSHQAFNTSGSPLTARGHPETRLVSVSKCFPLHTRDPLSNISNTDDSSNVYHSCDFLHVCVPGVVVMSRVLSSLLPGECVWDESCLWLNWIQMCWTACTHWVVSETESSSRVTCNAKSKSFSAANTLAFWA